MKDHLQVFEFQDALQISYHYCHFLPNSGQNIQNWKITQKVDAHLSD
jgi:hypothetical protein